MSKFISALLLLSGLALSGCAGFRTVQADVQTFSDISALPTSAGFKFERLPSQAEPNQHQAEAEAAAEAALTAVGLQRNDKLARYAVQIGVRVQRADLPDWPDAWQYWGFGGPHFWRVTPWPSPWVHNTPWFEREVSLTLRDLQTGQIVYETHAHQGGVSSDHKALIPALFQAALSGFPASQPSLHSVSVQLATP